MARTFRQLGQGYGSNPVTITAFIGGSEVFSGTVPTVNASPPGEVRPEPPEQVCFTWNQDDAWTGTVSFSITNTGSGTFQICQTQALSNVQIADSWTQVFAETVPGPGGNIVLGDPFSNVSIDGIAQTKPTNTDAYGQWTWNIGSGSTFAATLNVNLPAQS